MTTSLPVGPAPLPVASPHFPSRLHAYVWRNWQLVPARRLAEVVGASPEQIIAVGHAMGLSGPPEVDANVRRRSAITVIRRNWHLLPYEQLLALLGWTDRELAYSLREDDFLYVKLGNLKPRCEPLRYRLPDATQAARSAAIAMVVRGELGNAVGEAGDPLFSFVERLSQPPGDGGDEGRMGSRSLSRFTPRICSSYFALYGDPLLEEGPGPYPDGYLARLANSGVDAVWLQAVLSRLAPFPWDPTLSARYEDRLTALADLVARAGRQGMRVYLYLNEPRAMPLPFYERHPELRGSVAGDHAALCTSAPAVQEYLRRAVASIQRATPDLGGFFTITASENLTNCWSHVNSHAVPVDCPRCSQRSGAEVIAEVNTLIAEGIREGGGGAELLVWDWGWPDERADRIIARLPAEARFMSVSEWSLPIRRGGVDSVVGEYALSAIGPGPRATRHWGLARSRGLKTIAKVQAGSTWELSALPYIPVVANAARHAANLRQTGVDGLLLGWTLGGYPSPNLEAVAALGSAPEMTVDGALEQVARRRFGPLLWAAAVAAWQTCSAAFAEFPYHIGVVYHGPQQMGPANPLWETPTGYAATMVGLPYDDLDRWRAVYPPEVFAAQLAKAAEGFEAAAASLEAALDADPHDAYAAALRDEGRVVRAAALHLRAAANAALFVLARAALASAPSGAEAAGPLADLEGLLGNELDLARQLYAIQTADARIGFEATNQYYYVPLDLAEKVINCRDLLDRWLPAQRRRFL